MTSRTNLFALGLAAFLTIAGAGCGEDSWSPSGVGELTDREASQEIEIDLGSDLAPGALVDEPAGGLELAGLAEPRVLFLWYADGSAPPSASVCKTAVPPAYKCSFGTTVDDCAAKTQAHLDKFYADFNIVFTRTKPTSGRYYTEVVTNTNSWCSDYIPGAGTGGIAPFACKDQNANTCYAFLCGASAKTCAVIIAQEHAHLVGLEHTTSKSDIMYPSVCSTCTGFEDVDNSVSQARCSMAQNSYALMKARLGAREGGGGGGGGSGGAGGAGGGGGGGGAGGGAGDADGGDVDGGGAQADGGAGDGSNEDGGGAGGQAGGQAGGGNEDGGGTGGQAGGGEGDGGGCSLAAAPDRGAAAALAVALVTTTLGRRRRR